MNKTIMYKEILGQPKNIRDCYDFNKDEIRKIATAIKDFKPANILITARGTSMHSGILAKYLFQLYYNIPVAMATPSIFTVYEGKVDLSRTLVIAISQSGGGKDVMAPIVAANRQGGLTLAITNTPDSIVAKEAKHHLYNNCGEAVAYAATKTYSTTIYLLMKLLYEITLNQDIRIDENKIVDVMNEALKLEEQVRLLVRDFKDAHYGLTLARGYTLSLAMEMALKMKEACHFPVDAFPTSEFYHGPIVIANKETPTVLFAFDKKTNKDVQKMAMNLKELGVYTLAITNDENLARLCNQSLYVSEFNDLHALFGGIVILQLFTCELALLKDENPDYAQILDHIDTF